MSKAITEKKYYRVPDIFEKSDSFLSDLPCGAWCTDKLNMQEVEKMNFYNEVMHNDKFKCISGKINSNAGITISMIVINIANIVAFLFFTMNRILVKMNI